MKVTVTGWNLGGHEVFLVGPCTWDLNIGANISVTNCGNGFTLDQKKEKKKKKVALYPPSGKNEHYSMLCMEHLATVLLPFPPSTYFSYDMALPLSSFHVQCCINIFFYCITECVFGWQWSGNCIIQNDRAFLSISVKKSAWSPNGWHIRFDWVRRGLITL